MTNDLAISLLQHVSTPGDIAAGIARLERAARSAAAQGSHLLLTPECSLTGYDMTPDDAQAAAFAIDSDTARQIARIAQHNAIAIAYGFMEEQAGKRYNSVRVLDDKGELLLHYRKSHLWGELDRNLFSSGDTLAPVVSYRGWRLSALICYDVEFPEAVRSLALAGAQLVLVPTALMSPFRFVAEQMVPVRAAENQIYLAYANLVGQERETVYEGRSTVAGPEGSVLSKAPGEGEALLHAVLSTDTIAICQAAFAYHSDRRPELYAAVARSATLRADRSSATSVHSAAGTLPDLSPDPSPDTSPDSPLDTLANTSVTTRTSTKINPPTSKLENTPGRTLK